MNLHTPILTVTILFLSQLGFGQGHGINNPFAGRELFLQIDTVEQVKVLEQASGFLNDDSALDLALIFELRDSMLISPCPNCDSVKINPRIIVVSMNRDGDQLVFSYNNVFIAKGDEGGMVNNLLPELKIEKGRLEIFYQYDRTFQSYTFEYRNHGMYIVNAEKGGVINASGDYENDFFDFEKGEIVSTTGNISGDEEKVERIEMVVEAKSLPMFKEMYDWEVADGKFL